jgi:hypothetical protein
LILPNQWEQNLHLHNLEAPFIAILINFEAFSH